MKLCWDPSCRCDSSEYDDAYDVSDWIQRTKCRQSKYVAMRLITQEMEGSGDPEELPDFPDGVDILGFLDYMEQRPMLDQPDTDMDFAITYMMCVVMSLVFPKDMAWFRP